MSNHDPVCVVDLRVSGASADVIERIIRVLVAAGALPRVDLREDFAAACLSALPSEARVWIRGDWGAVDTWLRARSTGHVSSFATLELDGQQSARRTVDLLERLFDANVFAFVVATPPNGAEALATLRAAAAPVAAVLDTHAEVDEQTAWRHQLPAARRMISGDGTVDAGSCRPIWDMAAEELQRELGAEAAPFIIGGAAWHTSVALPDGRKIRTFLVGSSQGRGQTHAQLEGQAALGFESHGDFESWIASLARGSAPDVTFPSFPFLLPVAGATNRDGVPAFVKPKKGLQRGVVLAALIMNGDRRRAELMLGLHFEAVDVWNGDVHGIVPERLPPEILERLVVASLTLLATACAYIAVSRAPLEMRKRAALTVAYLGVSESRRVAKWIAKRCPELGSRHVGALRNDAAKRQANTVHRNPLAALALLRDQLRRALALTTGGLS